MFSQLFLDGLVTGLIIALPTLALTLIFGILRFPNFAIGAMLTSGAYLIWVGNALVGLPLWIAACAAALVFVVAAVLIDGLVFSKLWDRGGITLMVASMALSIVLDNICRFAFGNDPRNFDVQVSRPMRWEGLSINHVQIISAATVLFCLALLHVLLRHTALGRAMRAVADNVPLAAVRGIERQTIARVTWGVAGILTVAAGMLIGLDGAIDPLMGSNYVIPIFAAAILGGLGSPAGAVIGALVIGLVGDLSTLVVPTDYRQAMAFLVLVSMLLLRPQGLFGKRIIRK